ncbi:MAG: hypothetical protein ABTD50_01495 [Polyangiaceae bacterium]|jgi:hypothetical protein
MTYELHGDRITLGVSPILLTLVIANPGRWHEATIAAAAATSRPGYDSSVTDWGELLDDTEKALAGVLWPGTP